MKLLKLITSISLLCLLIWSCTKKIDYKGEEEDKLVIFSILENNKPIRVHLGRSAAMQHYPLHLFKLKPLLYTDSGDTIILHHDSAGWYSSFVQAHIDESYHIEVAYNDKLYNAHTQVPQKPNVLYATIQYSGHDAPNDSGPICILKTSLVDNPNTTDYYVCEISDDTSPAYWYTYQMTEPVILNEGYWQYDPYTLFFSDEMFNGDTLTMQFNIFDNKECIPNYIRFLRVYNISESRYMYYKSWTKHRYLQQSGDTDLDWWETLFKGEPTDMYSNVENGFGVFMSRAADSVVLECIEPGM